MQYRKVETKKLANFLFPDIVQFPEPSFSSEICDGSMTQETKTI